MRFRDIELTQLADDRELVGMNELRIPPAERRVHSGEVIAKALGPIIGSNFPLTGKARTDGSKLRQLIGDTLAKKNLVPVPATEGTYALMPHRGKGIPRLLRHCIDTYIVTSGDSYNLQIWNRLPNSDTDLVRYRDGKTIAAKDIRLVLAKIDVKTRKVSTILIMSPAFVERTFGKFGVPTIKHQLMIKPAERAAILASDPPILTGRDTRIMEKMTVDKKLEISVGIKEEPAPGKIYSLAYLKDSVAVRLVDLDVKKEQTKNKAQSLERIVADYLGYTVTDSDLLEGGYPDFRNQLLEVKLQDSPTVDLGRYTPEHPEGGFCRLNVTTKDVRYMIGLSDEKTNKLKGIALLSGADLGQHFTYVSATSYKCQRSIPMDFIKRFEGQSVYLG